MKITVTEVVPTRDSLALALRLEYTENGPIRFAQVQVPDEVLDWHALQALAAYVVRLTNTYLDREREILDETPLPGM